MGGVDGHVFVSVCLRWFSLFLYGVLSPSSLPWSVALQTFFLFFCLSSFGLAEMTALTAADDDK